MENNQTAVEWLFKHIENARVIDEQEFIKLKIVFEKAKEMENEELLDAFKSGWMRANAMNYQDSYFNYYINNK